MNDFIYELIHASNNTITWNVMACRGIIVFLFAIILIKVGGKRIFGKQSTIDIIIGITMGTILGKAITGNAPFIPSLITCVVMSLFHRFLAMITFRNDFIGRIIKGNTDLLVENGIKNIRNMKKTNVCDKDLMEALREHGIDDISKVKKAFLERSGRVSVIKFD
jgi:uncharacterized membrane protein YcaP (DUF421 family)